MIISRTPLRISLGGGGTDLPTYYSMAGHGFLIAAAITKYVYIAINPNFDSNIFLRYSEVERCDSVDDVRHPLLRECLRATGITDSIEISSMADIPKGTGLGSSGSFTVGLLKALKMYRHQTDTNESLASEACRIEIEVLNEPVGKQDQYIAAVGGISAFTFHRDGSVDIQPLELPASTHTRINDNLLLFYTGVRRSASEVLAVEQSGMKVSKNTLSENLDNTREIGYRAAEIIQSGDLDSFGRLLTDQWKLKLARQPNALHEQIDDWITAGINAGALGGKLVGAGGGGFLLFYSDRKAALRAEMESRGLIEVPFDIDYEGSTILVAR